MRKRILLLTLQAPKMPGMGGEVRSYYLIRMATGLGDVTLISLGGPDGEVRVQSDIAAACQHVVQPSDQPHEFTAERARTTRFGAWQRLLIVLLFPWRNRWSDFLTYFIQYCPADAANHPALSSLSKRVLRAILEWEFDVLSRWSSIPPLTCFLFDRSYGRIEQAVDRVCHQGGFDLLWLEHTLAWPFAEDLLRRLPNPEMAVICSAHNVESQVCQRIAEKAADHHERWYWQRQQALMTRMEGRAYRRSRLVIQCSENDADLTRQMVPAAQTCVVGNGVNVDYFQSLHGSPGDTSPTILFTAGFGYGPNREAVEYFVRSIFPLIRQQCPDAGFLMAGAQAQEVFESLQDSSGFIECVSNPVDIRPCFERCRVYVVPLLAGGGTRLKILEAMAMGRPVVSTSLGAEGVPYVDGQDLLLADSPEEFAAKVVGLLTDPVLREKLTANALRFVKQHYDWNILCERAKPQLAELV